MDYCTPAGIRDLEELLSGSPGIHRAPEKPEDGAKNPSRGKSEKKKPGRPGENRSERSGRNSGSRRNDSRPSAKPEARPRKQHPAGKTKKTGKR